MTNMLTGHVLTTRADTEEIKQNHTQLLRPMLEIVCFSTYILLAKASHVAKATVKWQRSTFCPQRGHGMCADAGRHEKWGK